MSEKRSGIYQIRNIINDKVYIGSTNDLSHRRSRHFSMLKFNKHTNAHLQHAYNLYGRENFIFEILLYCHISELTIIEQEYLQKTDWQNIYNISEDTSRPALGMKHTLEAKEKMAISKRGENNYWYHCDPKDHPWYGKKHSKESIEKMREAKLLGVSFWQGKHTPISKPVRQLDAKTKTVIAVFPSGHVAMKVTGVDASSICKCCKRKQKTAGGFLWEYS